MDLQPIHHQEATTSSSASSSTRIQLPDLDSSSSTTAADSRALRTSARVKAAKQKSKAKGKGKECDSIIPEQSSSSAAALSADTSRAIRIPRSKRFREAVVGATKTKESTDETFTRSSKRYLPSIVTCALLD